MYWLFKKHHWKPSVYITMTETERQTVRAFIRQEAEDIEKMNKEIEEAAHG